MAISLGFRAAGEGPALVLLHAFPLSAAMWELNFARLKESAMVVAPNLRGFGTSPAGESATMDEMADDVARLMDRLSVKTAVIGGCSMGGYVAMAMWRRHPARVSGLVLVDTRSVADTEEQRAGRAEFAAAVKKGGAQVAVERLLPKLIASGASTAVRNFVRELIVKGTPESIATALLGLGARPDSTPLLPTITVPTLVVCGAEDAIIPPAEQRELCANIPGARFVEIPGAGHLPNLEAKEAFDAAVGGFMVRFPVEGLERSGTGV